jgi:hypothetical protein
MQVERLVDYEPTSDLLGFFHAQKTGGTSLSDVLKELFPDGVVPGSDRSKYFMLNFFKDALERKPIDFWSRQRVLYSHSSLRPQFNGVQKQKNPRNGFLLDYLRTNALPLAEKKVRLLVMLREPVSWRASAYYEAMCHIGRWIQEKQQTLADPSECPTVNLTDVVRVRLDRDKQNCANGRGGEICLAISLGKNPFEHCESIDTLLNSGKMHNMYHERLWDYCRYPLDGELVDAHLRGC